MLTDDYLDGDVVSDREALWVSRFENPPANQHVLVAEQAARIVGFACAYSAHETAWGTLLENLHVMPTHKGFGIGTRLLKAMGKLSRRLHPDLGMHLWVLQANVSAQAFYRRQGAMEVERSVWHAPGGLHIPQLRYAWPELDALMAPSPA